MKNIKKILSAVIIIQLFTCSAFAAETIAKQAQAELNLQEIALPSEVKDMGKSSGSIYYSTSVKNKVLIPVNIWGEVRQSGLHFVPADTTLIKGISLAGGPGANAKLDSVVLTRTLPNSPFKEMNFDLSKGGDLAAHEFKIEPGDTIFVKKDTFYENRAYYTSLVGVVFTLISTFLILKKVD